MVKNDKIVRIDESTIGLVLGNGRLLVIEDDSIVSMGLVPEETYFIHPNEVVKLPWTTKIILNAVMITYGIESPFIDLQPVAQVKKHNHLREL